MGILSCLEPPHRLAAPDTPPELVSPTSSSYSSRPSPFADQTWGSAAAPISPPMSSYDHNISTVDMSSAGKSMEDGHKRSEQPPRHHGAPQGPASNTQLPPISSLLPEPIRPSLGHSTTGSYSDHRMPLPPASSLDRPPVTSAPAERVNHAPSAHYYSHTSSPPITQPRTAYEPRYDDGRAALHHHALARSHSGHGSPGPSSGGSKWSTGQHEYSLAGRDVPPLPSPQDRPPMYPGPPTREPQQPMFHRDPRLTPHHGAIPNPPPTPTSTVSEGVPTKDGLGPKIWTGTHFLPRFVRSAEVPGEGLCYFYDDGSHCKAVIDGEAVNAHWGVTKAGKPRKRLAIACITCREKKIKCDPDYPRCVQCEKFGRTCKFKNAPRGGHNTSPSTPPAEPEDHRRVVAPLKPNELHHRPGSNSSASVSPRTTLRLSSPEPQMHHHHHHHHSKRVRVGYESYSPVHDHARPPMTHTPELAQPTSRPWQHQPPPPPPQHHHHQQQQQQQQHQHQHQQPIELPRIHEEALSQRWRNDPYVTSNPQTHKSVMSTITSFFVNIDSTTVLRFLPERAFKSWVVEAETYTRCPEDKMLGYSMLALGAALLGANRREDQNRMWMDAMTARHAQNQTARDGQNQTVRLSLQLVQCRIVLAVFYLAMGRPFEASEFSSSACGAALELQLNRELHQSDDANLAVFPFNMSRHGFAESRRRTFWSCFMLERLMDPYSKTKRPAMLNADDIFIRLPSSDESFEEQADAQMPQYAPLVPKLAKESVQAEGVSGQWVQMVDLWTAVMAGIYRSIYRPPASDSDSVEWHDRMRTCLGQWEESLPEALAFSEDNMESALRTGNLASFVAMRVLFHQATIKLHRYAHPAQLLSPEAKAERLGRVRDHAIRILEMVALADSFIRVVESGMTTLAPTVCSAVLEAVDVLSAEGSMAQLPKITELSASARPVIVAMTAVWDEIRGRHLTMMDSRLNKLRRIQERGSEAASPRSGCRVFSRKTEAKAETETKTEGEPGAKQEHELCWQLSESMDNPMPMNMDLVYTNLTQVPPLYG